MDSLDPWSKAAECEQAIERVADPQRRIVLENLRSLWIELSSNVGLLRDDRADQLSMIAQIHAELMLGYRTAMH